MLKNNIPYMDEKNTDRVWSPFLKNLDSNYAVNSTDDISKLKDSDIIERRRYLELELNKLSTEKTTKDKTPHKSLF